MFLYPSYNINFQWYQPPLIKSITGTFWVMKAVLNLPFGTFENILTITNERADFQESRVAYVSPSRNLTSNHLQQHFRLNEAEPLQSEILSLI